MPNTQHNTEINKSLALKTTMAVLMGDNQYVDIFVVEVGAREYCSKSVFCCFKILNFNNTLSETLSKNQLILLQNAFLHLVGESKAKSVCSKKSQLWSRHVNQQETTGYLQL